jgi:hypothetical protein
MLFSKGGDIVKMTVRDLRLEFLKKELELVQEKINHLDDLRHRTKQMAVTLWAATIAFAASITTNQDLIYYLAAFIPLPFWFLEANYHRHQEGYTARLKAVRSFIQTGKFVVRGEQEVSLQESIMSEDFAGFPVLDFYGMNTIDKNLHKRLTHPILNFFKLKTLIFYIPLIAIPILLVVFT